MALSFLKDVKKNLAKLENISLEFAPPHKWYNTGNFMVNKRMSGSYFRGVPQSRVTILAGPSGCITADEVVNVYIMKSKREVIEVKSS